ncbi:MAG: hypothetical protein M3Y88_07055 [Chloroflexota bacterium]|nr:hypothetical protein [Chloroflexota bacterium]
MSRSVPQTVVLGRTTLRPRARFPAAGWGSTDGDAAGLHEAGVSTPIV